MINRLVIYIHVLIFILVACHITHSQDLNTTFRSNWDDDALPSQGVTYNDIWGYADGQGREYAIMGSRLYTHFIDITDPDHPVEVDREEGGSSCLWRDFKTFGHYAYGVSEVCGGGLEIYDLSPLPDSVKKVYDANDFINDTHNVFIDTLTGKLYATGFSSEITDIVILDLNQNPETPVLIKKLRLSEYGYVHDLYVRNDTAYCSHIYAGRMVIYDFSDPNDPTIIGQLLSTGANHSNWVSDDGKTMIIADETHNNPVLVADLSNIETPTLVSSFQSKLLGPTNSIAHNPYIVGNDFVILSYYDDGLQIYKIDSSDQPFLAGYYDTDTLGTSYSGDGAWGAYPYLPSGNLIASDIENGLYVITPKFPLRDCLSQVQVEGVYDNHWDFVSQDQFSTSATYQDGTDLIIRAPGIIELLPGFNIGSGSVLTANIEDLCAVAHKGGKYRGAK